MANENVGGSPYLGSTRNPFSYEKVEQISRDVTSPWLTLEEITQQLNLFDDESQDGYILNLELATRMAIEDYLGLTIFPIQYKVYYGATSSTGTQVSLDLPEVSQDTNTTIGVTINSVGYWSFASPPVFTLLDPTEYFYDHTGNKVICNGIPNEVNTVISNPLVVTYTTGSSPLSQYPVIRQAGLLLLTHLYNNRSNTVVNSLQNIPFGVDQLLRPYKPLVL